MLTVEHHLYVSHERRYVFIHNHKTAGRSVVKTLEALDPAFFESKELLFPRRDKCLRQHLSELGCDGYEVLGFVRNPWDRLVSWYSMMHNHRVRCGFQNLFRCEVCREFTRDAAFKRAPILPSGDPEPAQCPKCSAHALQMVFRPDWHVIFLKGNWKPFWINTVLAPDRGFTHFVRSIVSHVDATGDSVGMSQVARYFSDLNGVNLATHIGKYETLQQDFDAFTAKVGLATKPLPVANTSVHFPYQAYYTPESRARVAKLFAEDIESFGYEFNPPLQELGVESETPP